MDVRMEERPKSAIQALREGVTKMLSYATMKWWGMKIGNEPPTPFKSPCTTLIVWRYSRPSATSKI
jgi:hypothetical protein